MTKTLAEIHSNPTSRTIVDELMSSNRKGMGLLVEQMLCDGFFTSPASTKYHGAYAGGLADHSVNVFQILETLVQQSEVEICRESLAIAALLHDLCKVGAYLGDSAPYTWNKKQPAGHSELSIQRIEQFLELTYIERQMIRFHMGPWHYDSHSLKSVWNEHPVVKLMYFADEIATHREKKAEAAV